MRCGYIDIIYAIVGIGYSLGIRGLARESRSALSIPRVSFHQPPILTLFLETGADGQCAVRRKAVNRIPTRDLLMRERRLRDDGPSR